MIIEPANDSVRTLPPQGSYIGLLVHCWKRYLGTPVTVVILIGEHLPGPAPAG